MYMYVSEDKVRSITRCIKKPANAYNAEVNFLLFKLQATSCYGFIAAYYILYHVVYLFIYFCLFVCLFAWLPACLITRRSIYCNCK